jgi:hypothetical protein
LARNPSYVDWRNTSGTEDGTPANPYNTVKEGTEAVLPYGTVSIAGGNYPEQITIWQPMTLNATGGGAVLGEWAYAGKERIKYEINSGTFDSNNRAEGGKAWRTHLKEKSFRQFGRFQKHFGPVLLRYWQYIDGSNGGARTESSERSGLLWSRNPLGVTIAGANVHDTKLLAETLGAIVVERPEPTPEAPQHLCLDKGYDNPTGHTATAERKYVPHIRRIGEEKLDKEGNKTYPARRYVVERTLAWLSKCRGILIRYDKNWENYLGCLQFACALLWFRRLCGLWEFWDSY